MADGHLNKCKECAKRDSRAAKLAKPELYRALDKEYAQRPDVREKARDRARLWARANAHRNLSAAWRKRNPEATRAHAKVQRALASGKLARLPCELCGESRADAHHDDYSAPLDVRWLCRPCHKQEHSRTRSA